MSKNGKNLAQRKIGGHRVRYVSVADRDINGYDLRTKNQCPAFSVGSFTTDQLSYDSEKKATNFANVTSGSDPHVTRNADMRRTSEAEPDG